jgi:predicted AlkP superfamily pyrophosphatase or phosphodiesterase
MKTLISALLLGATLTTGFAADKERHVVVIVWDGMRPDFITEENSPTLYQLSQQGVWFADHHPVYLSTTEVNGTAIATGAYPDHDGIIANKEFRPEINELAGVHTEDFESVRKGDEATHGHYVRVPTTAEILRSKHFKTVVAGAKPVAMLHDRAERPDGFDSVDLFAGRTVPASALASITQLYGPFPGENSTVTRNDWTAGALINPLWKNGVPAFSVLWMSEPDASQHLHGPGSPEALKAIRNVDDNLARVLKALDEKGVRDKTDIMLVSDHGFSSITSIVDVPESLRNAGFKAVTKFTSKPAEGDIMVVPTGGSFAIYVIGHNAEIINRLVEFFQKWPSTGVIFTKNALPGTFTLAQAKIDSPAAPDIMISMRWTDAKSDNGTPGEIVCCEPSYHPGQGMHGTLSHYDMHNTFIAAGPDFRRGVVNHLATGNVDIAPTALWLLGQKIPSTMDGRVVTEALAIPGPKLKSFEPKHIEASRDLGNVSWKQYLNSTEVNGTVYFDEGNGKQTVK